MYKPTIGLEIHVQLKTKTKMFCGCLNISSSEIAELRGLNVELRGKSEIKPNTNICPICTGYPGTLPTINKKAVESVLKLGLALNSEIPETSKFDRKNYFYPDLPKGYQISQYDKPLVIGGSLNNVKITRIHLEEDTARLLHTAYSLVDFNRAGIPLMELVTEPNIKSGEEAVEFARELQLILRYLEISDADMEKGQMRIEANISVSKNSEFGTKVEVKNLNSFRAVKEAIDYEIKRQSEILDEGQEVKHETRGWDENKKITVSQRLKEKAHDYRYFPEPDLPILDLTDFDLGKLKAEIPELPLQKRERFLKEFGLMPEQAEILINEPRLAEYFEKSVSELFSEISENGDKNKHVKLLFNYLTSDFKGLMNEISLSIDDIKIIPENFADLIVLIIKGEISSRLAKEILREMAASGLDPRRIIVEKGLIQISDEETIKKAVMEIIAKNPKAVIDYKKGKENSLQFLIGQAMAELKGQTSPDILRKIFLDYLSK
ncbi:MAG: Asp-tRNA(Asn)/Glu-tRNA(Gln) amidotransferase subunit GatB [Patescibacteria group bacterium]